MTDARRFGLFVGVALVLLALAAVRLGASPWLLAPGALALGLALGFPAAFAPMQRAWRKVANRVLLGLYYGVVVVPVGRLGRLLGHDPLGVRQARRDTWRRPLKARPPQHLREQS